MKQTKEKPFKIAFIRKLEWQYAREEITYSRAVELLNEKAEAYAAQFKAPLDLSEAEQEVINSYQFPLTEVIKGTGILHDANEVLVDGSKFRYIILKLLNAYFNK